MDGAGAGAGAGAGPGFLTLPSGRVVRGGPLVGRRPPGWEPDLAVQLSWRRPRPPAWDREWIRWPDFRSPSDPRTALEVLRRAWERAADERVEIGCRGGVGRTGTALAALVVLEGRRPEQAISWVRDGYHLRAVEMPSQWRFLQYVTDETRGASG